MAARSLTRGFWCSTLVLSFVSAPARAQLDWHQGHVSPAPGDSCSRLSYDSARQRTVLFASDFAGEPTIAEWTGVRWIPLAPSTSPPPRRDFGLVYDEARGRTLLYGGWNFARNSVALLFDTWEWDGSEWRRRHTAGAPGAVGFGMAYDAGRGRVVLFGLGCAACTGETWEWDGSHWVRLYPAVSPPPRWHPAMAYDAEQRRVVLFGGLSAASVLADTWEWDGAEWRQASPALSPPARFGAGMAYDAARRRIVLFGGAHDVEAAFADTWEWDGTQWTEVLTARSPDSRHSVSLAYHAACDHVLLHGGVGPFGEPSEGTWVYRGPLEVQALSPAFGPGAGDDLVEILVSGGTRVPDTFVAFGGAPATVVARVCDRITVRTPPGGGTVDVTVSNSLGTAALPAAYTYVPADVVARYGNVNAGRGELEDVVFLNGSAGDALAREIHTAVRQHLRVVALAPSSAPAARFVLYAWPGAPSGDTLAHLPQGAGAMVFPPPCAQLLPEPIAIWNNLGHRRALGTPTHRSWAAPSVVLDVPAGVRRPANVSFQGLIEDQGSAHGSGISVTNAIVLRVE